MSRSALGRKSARILGIGLRLALGAIVLFRAILLIAGGDVLTARSERRFLDWSYRDPRLHVLLSEAALRTLPGDALCLMEARPQVGPDWLRVMGVYYLPERIVVVASNARARRCPLCRRSALILRPEVSPRERRGDDVAPR